MTQQPHDAEAGDPDAIDTADLEDQDAAETAEDTAANDDAGDDLSGLPAGDVVDIEALSEQEA